MISNSFPILSNSIVLLTLFTFLGCKQNSSEKPIYMAFDQVEYVNDFPETFNIKDNISLEIDVIGIRDFLIYDSVMVLRTSNPEGIWSLISLPHYHHLGSFLSRGEGPLEFMQGPSPSSQSNFIRENGQLISYLYDFQNGNLKKFDIGQTIASGELNISLMEASFPPFLSNFIRLDSNTFFIKEIGNKDTQQIRQLIVSGEKTELHVLEMLNQGALREGSDFNILATNTKYSYLHEIFVEAPTELNYINLYSLNGKLAKTICIGDKLTDIARVQNERPQWNRKYVFVNIQAFDDFFGVIYVNESFKDYETIRRRLPSILLFDWEGKPLAELKMVNHFTHFDIDFFNQELYTFDVHSDEFFKFDIRNILTRLKANI